MEIIPSSESNDEEQHAARSCSAPSVPAPIDDPSDVADTPQTLEVPRGGDTDQIFTYDEQIEEKVDTQILIRRSTHESMDEEVGVINALQNTGPIPTLFDLAYANLVRGEIAQHLDLQSLGRFGITCKLNHDEVLAEIESRKKQFFDIAEHSGDINDVDNDAPRSWWRRHQRNNMIFAAVGIWFLGTTVAKVVISQSRPPPSGVSTQLSCASYKCFCLSIFLCGFYDLTTLDISFSQRCFQDKAELQFAVDAYISQGCAINSGCIIAQTYGWPMNSWCVSKVTDMSHLFQNLDTFNEDISGWDVSSVTDMEDMFLQSHSFNSDISSWTVSSVTRMDGMFFDATSFNIDISSWNITSVTEMDKMLALATSFNRNLCAWVDKFPYGSATNIFVGSGCNIQEDPQLSHEGLGYSCPGYLCGGPFCATSCMHRRRAD